MSGAAELGWILATPLVGMVLVGPTWAKATVEPTASVRAMVTTIAMLRVEASTFSRKLTASLFLAF